MAGCAPERIHLQPFAEGISNCCREGGGVRVSSQSGSVHSTLLVQSALYCKSLLINLMPLAELHSRLQTVATKKKPHIKLCWSSSVRWIKTFRLFIMATLTFCYITHFNTVVTSQGLQPESRKNRLMQPDTPVESSGPYINCSLSLTATITVMQDLFVKLQVCWLMSGSARAFIGPKAGSAVKKTRIWPPF